jgi:dolichol-phosphate mannosyltransferase
MPRTLVALATYNERENLRALVQAILGLEVPDLDILIVDDNSPDGTGQIADELAAEHSEVKVVHRRAKLGLGTAQTGAMEMAQLGGYDSILTMDADFSHDPQYIPALLERMDECDLVIGSRYVPGGDTEDWGPVRKLMSWGANTFVRLVLGLKPKDCSSGFKCYRVGTLCRIDLSHIVARGYAFQEEMVYRLQLLGATIGEVPITFVNRKRGQTKMGLGEILGLFTTVLRLRWRRLVARLTGRGGI